MQFTVSLGEPYEKYYTHIQYYCSGSGFLYSWEVVETHGPEVTKSNIHKKPKVKIVPQML